MIKWLDKKFQNMGKQEAIRQNKEEEDKITLDCDGLINIRLADLVTEDVDEIPTYTVYLDYDVDIYFENNLESIKSKGSIHMIGLESKVNAYKFMIKQHKDGAKNYMGDLEKRVIGDYNNHLRNTDSDKLKEIIKQQKPIEVKFTLKV